MSIKFRVIVPPNKNKNADRNQRATLVSAEAQLQFVKRLDRMVLEGPAVALGPRCKQNAVISTPSSPFAVPENSKERCPLIEKQTTRVNDFVAQTYGITLKKS